MYERHQRQHAVGDRHVEVGALAGGGASHQRGQDGQGRLHPAPGGVGHGGPGQRRLVAGGPLAAVEVAAQGQVVDVVAGPLGVGAGLAVAAGRAVDDGRVHGAHVVVADAQAVDHAGSEALEHHVGGGGQVAGTRRGPRGT